METSDAVILAGGLGTRLASLPGNVPKVLRPVAGRPFLEHLLDQVRGAGINRIVLSLGHLHDAFEPHVDGTNVIASVEPSPMGTGGGLRHALPHLPSETILAMNGDSYVDADLSALLAVHRERKAEITILLARVDDASRFGRVEIDGDNRVTGFTEKGAAGPGLINAGVYVFHRSILEAIPEDRPVSFEREVLSERLGSRFYALAGDFPFIDIGTPESYSGADDFFRARRSS